MLNAHWLIPIHAHEDRKAAGLNMALDHVLSTPAQTASGERFINLAPGVDTAVLEQRGFRREAGVYLYVMNRSGLHRFFHHASTRYGELNALTQRRQRRRMTDGVGA